MKPFWVHTLLRLYITRLHEVFIYNFIKAHALDETTCPAMRHGVRHGHGRERPSQLSLVRRRRGLIIQKTRGGTIP